jgi:hypothetical protein
MSLNVTRFNPLLVLSSIPLLVTYIISSPLLLLLSLPPSPLSLSIPPQATLSMMTEVGYDQAFTYAYSRREQTYAGLFFKDDVEEGTKKRR